MSEHPLDCDRRMPRIEVTSNGTTIFPTDGGPYRFIPPDIWRRLVERIKAGEFDPKK